MPDPPKETAHKFLVDPLFDSHRLRYRRGVGGRPTRRVAWQHNFESMHLVFAVSSPSEVMDRLLAPPWRQVGAHAWLDMFEDDLTAPGMKRGVEESDVFVLILTTNVLTREFCRLEIGWALAARKPILVVREDDARFSAFEYDRWRADEVWDDDVGWTVPADAALRPYSSLGATPARRIRRSTPCTRTSVAACRRRASESAAARRMYRTQRGRTRAVQA